MNEPLFLREFVDISSDLNSLSKCQKQIFDELKNTNPDVDLWQVDELLRMRFKQDNVFQWETLEEVVRMFHPFVVQPGRERKIVFYKNGKWFHDGEWEVRRIVISLLGEDGTSNHANKLIKRMQITLPCYSVGSAVFDSSDMPYESENNNEEDFDDDLPF